MSDDDAEERQTKHDNKRHAEQAREHLTEIDTDVEKPWTTEKVDEALEATEEAHDQMTDDVESEDV